MTDMLRIAEEAAEQAKFSLVSIDLNTIVFTLINTLIIVLLYFFFLHKPVCKILDERAKTVNKDMDLKGRGSPHCSRRYKEGAGKRGRNHLCR